MSVGFAVAHLNRRGHQMRPISELIEALNDEDEFERREAQADLVQHGVGAVPPLLVALVDSRPRVRWGAATALGPNAFSDGTAIAGLTNALADPIQYVRQCAAIALSHVGKPAVPALIACLGSSNPEIQATAAFALGKIGKPAAEAEHSLAICFLTKMILSAHNRRPRSARWESLIFPPLLTNYQRRFRRSSIATLSQS